MGPEEQSVLWNRFDQIGLVEPESQPVLGDRRKGRSCGGVVRLTVGPVGRVTSRSYVIGGPVGLVESELQSILGNRKISRSCGAGVRLTKVHPNRTLESISLLF